MNLDLNHIDELKNMGYVTQVIPSSQIVEQCPSIDSLKEYNLVTSCDDSQAILNKANENMGIATWEYIWNEESWNASYENGGLKKYYVWSDKANAPYKEDLWNTVEHRAANINDAEKDPVTGEYLLDENGNYIYKDCVRCWDGALHAPGAKYPWCVVDPPMPFVGVIRFEYGDQVAYPWGEEARAFGRGFACASIPVELGDQYLLKPDGTSTFNPDELVVKLIK